MLKRRRMRISPRASAKDGLLPTRGKTILLTTHFMEEAEWLCHRLCVIEEGHKITEGASSALIASEIGCDVIEILIYLFGFGLVLMVGHVDGVLYIAFLAAGTAASSMMMPASFESMYSGFSRMHVQRAWEAIMHTPLTLGDIVLGEVVWAASKPMLPSIVIMLVAGALGYANFPSMLLALPVIVLTGLAFASIAMVVTARASSYEFFMFYQTLILTPM